MTNSRYKQVLNLSTPIIRWLTQTLKPFIVEWAQEPMAVGALCPSSRRLANAMAAQVDITKQGYHIELGAGTGVVTQALLDRGIDANKLIVIERSPRFVDILRKRFPNIRVIKGDATKLDRILATELDENIGIASIVSSLPLRSLAKEIKSSIMEQWELLLDSGGQIIQFSYFIFSSPSLNPNCFKETKSQLILGNIPPAKVSCYKRLRKV